MGDAEVRKVSKSAVQERKKRHGDETKRAEYILITPEMANEWLDKHGDENNLIHSICSRLYVYQSGMGFTSLAVSGDEVLETYRTDPETISAIATGARRVAGECYCSPSTIGLLWYLCQRIDVTVARYFFDRLGDGARLESSSPIMALRTRFRRARQPGNNATFARPIKKLEECVLIVLAWNRFVRGQDSKMIKWLTGDVPGIEREIIGAVKHFVSMELAYFDGKKAVYGTST